jgi:O-antigen/teichoic acid export membrane protein
MRFLLFGSASTLTVRLAKLFFLSKVFSLDDFGVAAMLMSLIAASELLFQFGRQVVFISTLSAPSDGFRLVALAKSNFRHNVVVAILLVAIGGVVRVISGGDPIAEWLTMLSLAALLFGARLPIEMVYEAKMQFGKKALFDISTATIDLAVSVILYFEGFGPILVLYSYLILRLIWVIVGFSVFKSFTIVSVALRRKNARSRAGRSETKLGLTSLLTGLTSSLDSFLIGVVLGHRVAAVYHLVSRISTAASRIAVPAMRSFLITSWTKSKPVIEQYGKFLFSNLVFGIYALVVFVFGFVLNVVSGKAFLEIDNHVLLPIAICFSFVLVCRFSNVLWVSYLTARHEDAFILKTRLLEAFGIFVVWLAVVLFPYLLVYLVGAASVLMFAMLLRRRHARNMYMAAVQ